MEDREEELNTTRHSFLFFLHRSGAISAQGSAVDLEQ